MVIECKFRYTMYVVVPTYDSPLRVPIVCNTNIWCPIEKSLKLSFKRHKTLHNIYGPCRTFSDSTRFPVTLITLHLFVKMDISASESQCPWAVVGGGGGSRLCAQSTIFFFFLSVFLYVYFTEGESTLF